MPSGAAVIRYDGKRGAVWKIKYRDASKRQVKETLGREEAGWNRRKATAALRHRLSDVEREAYRKPEATTFETFALEWIAEVPAARGLKESTRESYEAIVKGHLIPALGTVKLAELDADRLERYLAEKRKAGFGAATINRHLNLLSLLLKPAARRGLVRVNPVPFVDRSREPRRKWRILSPAEVRAVEQAFDELIDEAEEDVERAWRAGARVVFLVTYGTGLRRGELLGLRWRAVRLADPDGATLRVEETVVRGRTDTPKSEAGERTLSLGPRLASELFDHRGRSAFDGDDERVFCHPSRGSVLDHKRYTRTLRLALAKAQVEGRVRPFQDGRHSSITNAAAAGTSPAALMSRAGHSDFKTTQGYIDLAGERFREEAELLEQRLWGESGTKKRYQEGESSTAVTTEGAP